MHGEEFPLSRRCELGKERKGVPRPILRQDGFKTETAPRCEMQRFLFPQKVEHLSVDAHEQTQRAQGGGGIFKKGIGERLVSGKEGEIAVCIRENAQIAARQHRDRRTEDGVLPLTVAVRRGRGQLLGRKLYALSRVFYGGRLLPLLARPNGRVHGDPLVEKLKGGFHVGVAQEAASHPAAENGVVAGGDEHSGVVRHIAADHRVSLAHPVGGEIHCLEKSVGPVQSHRFHAPQILQRQGKGDAERKEGGVGREDLVFPPGTL